MSRKKLRRCGFCGRNEREVDIMAHSVVANGLICGDCSIEVYEFLRLERLKRMAKANKAEWYKVLGVGKDATDGEINKAFRRLVKVAHPDAGGTHEAMTGLTVARDEGLRVWWDD